MRKLAVVIALLGVANRGFGQEAAAVAAHPAPPKIEHLLKAAEHLEAAGLVEDADKVRQWAETARQDQLGVTAPQVKLKIRVVELSRSRLQRLGFAGDLVGSASNVPHEAIRGLSPAEPQAKASNGSSECSVLDSQDVLLKVVDAMRDDHLARIMAEPNLVTVSNRPASLQAGGISRVAVLQDNGKVTVEEKPYGTRVDFIPIVSDDQTIHLECRVELSHLDPENSVTVAGETVPTLRTLRVDTASRCRSGQTIVLCGVRQQRNISPNPTAFDASAAAAKKTDDKPKAKSDVEEIETLVLLTPEILPPRLSEKSTATGISR